YFLFHRGFSELRSRSSYRKRKNGPRALAQYNGPMENEAGELSDGFRHGKDPFEPLAGRPYDDGNRKSAPAQRQSSPFGAGLLGDDRRWPAAYFSRTAKLSQGQKVHFPPPKASDARRSNGGKSAFFGKLPVCRKGKPRRQKRKDDAGPAFGYGALHRGNY